MSGAWIEERGIVVVADLDWATVQIQRQSTCGSCAARTGCGSGLLAEVLGRRAPELRLANTHGLRTGDRVILGIQDHALVSGALVMYLLPLLGLIGMPVLLGSLLPAVPEGALILAGIAGFVLGLGGVRYWLQRQGRRLQPILLGREPVVGRASEHGPGAAPSFLDGR